MVCNAPLALAKSSGRFVGIIKEEKTEGGNIAIPPELPEGVIGSQSRNIVGITT
jgi:hypothetical protein